MKDYLGKEIHVGDEVILTDNRYNEFNTGIVRKITDKMVHIELTKPAAIGAYRIGLLVRRFPAQTVVIDRK